MKTLSFRAYNDTVNNGMNICSRCLLDRPIILNCVGNMRAETPFLSQNRRGRLDYYLMLITQGELLIDNGEGEISCSAGSLIVFPPKTKYKYRTKTGKPMNYLWVHFTGYDAEAALSRCKIDLFPNINKVLIDASIIRIFQSIFAAFNTQDQLRDYELSALLERLLITISRKIGQFDLRSARALTKAIEYINSSYDQKIKIPFLAKLENLSTSRFNTVFKKSMGKAPTEYIAELRIRAACELLSSTSLSVGEIGETVGYEDSHFFSKVFKSFMGTSPSEYRSAVREEDV